MFWTRLGMGAALGITMALAGRTAAFASSAPTAGHTPLATAAPAGESDAGTEDFDVDAFCEQPFDGHASLPELCKVVASGQLSGETLEIVRGLIRTHAGRSGPGLASHLVRLLDDEGRPDAREGHRSAVAACRRLLASGADEGDRVERCHELLDRDDNGDFDAIAHCELLLGNERTQRQIRSLTDELRHSLGGGAHRRAAQAAETQVIARLRDLL